MRGDRVIYAHLPPFDRLNPKQQSPSDARGELKETQGIKAASIAAGGMRRDREKQLQAAYFPGATAANLASATGRSARTVRDYCKRLDLPLSKPRPQQREPVVPAAAFDLARRKW